MARIGAVFNADLKAALEESVTAFRRKRIPLLWSTMRFHKRLCSYTVFGSTLVVIW